MAARTPAVTAWAEPPYDSQSQLGSAQAEQIAGASDPFGSETHRRSGLSGRTTCRRVGNPVVRRTLLVTNDFPPRAGGIQSYVQSLAERLPADELVVYAPSWSGDAAFDATQPFPIYRHPGSLMLPGPSVRRRAAELVRDHAVRAVWYGAAAPLSLLTPALRVEGVTRTVASTHGHEVGWSMLPGPRHALRRIGRDNDVITFVSQYARRRISSALGPMAALEYLPPGVRVVNVGLNGVLVTEAQSSRTFTLRAEDWAKPITQPVYVVGRVESNSPTMHPSAPIVLQVGKGEVEESANSGQGGTKQPGDGVRSPDR